MPHVSQLGSIAAEAQPEVTPAASLAGRTTSLRGKLRRGLAIIFSFPAMALSLLAGLVYYYSYRGLTDPDIWWHLRNAGYLFAHHQFIRADMYSYTVIGHPWMNPEWLAEMPYYVGWRIFGLAGIKAVQLGVTEFIFFGLAYLCWRQSRNIKGAVIACFFAVLLATVNLGPRTILFGYALLIVLLVILERFGRQGRGPLWLIPLLFCVWINTHGSWLLGLVVFGIFIGGGLVGGQWGRIEATRWSNSELRKLLLTMGASVAALFVNPYGFRLVFYPLDMALRQRLNIAHVQEWQSVNFHNAHGKLVLIFIVVLVLGALLSRRKWQLTELVLALFGLYSGLTYERFLFFAAILTAPLLAQFLDVFPPYQREIDKPWLNAGMMAGVAGLMIFLFPSNAQLRQSVGKVYPAGVVSYLKAHPPQGRVLNDYLFGGYLIWKDPAFKDFVDSRVDVFEYAGVFKDYIDLLELRQAQRVLDKYGIRYVLFSRHEPLTFMLSQNPKWRVIYKGKVSVMLERVSPAPNPAPELPSGSKSLLPW